MIDIQQTNIYTDETQLGLEFEVVAHSLSYLDDSLDTTPASAISFDSTESEESVHDKKLITTAITTDGTVESESDSLYVRRLEHSHDSQGSTLNVQDSEEGSLTYAESHDANTTTQESINDSLHEETQGTFEQEFAQVVDQLGMEFGENELNSIFVELSKSNDCQEKDAADNIKTLKRALQECESANAVDFLEQIVSKATVPTKKRDATDRIEKKLDCLKTSPPAISECRSYTSMASEIPSPRTITREGPFRFDRLHEYGKGQMKLRRELELIHKLELNKREVIFQLNLANKQRKLKEGYNLPPLQQRGKRIHDTYSQKKNEAGRKLRMEIEARRELRRIEKSLWN
ncbi:predicted protein [Chaetoceros tenuissimus]|uniref:Uncharacterized protein n=1 Tax=Chaetoceros tenuissimus TaxID=426638 RepID=A0AAD3CRZ5_9STRA|nr:predicted protein [Chaetoceros tenuissimus]